TALSLLALPKAEGAVRVDAEHARDRGIFRAAPRPEVGPCAHKSVVWSDDHASGRLRSAGGG
ncbi:MAG TPA: hypothetical protein VGR53_11420, partial [Nitrososphaerales archaeon]|nr:hypothetical protein [Nitrososphaerales archaeon]